MYNQVYYWNEYQEYDKNYLWAFVCNNGYVQCRYNRFKNMNLEIREIVISWLFEICFHHSFNISMKIFVQATWIFDSYIDKITNDNIRKGDMQLVGISSLIIAISLSTLCNFEVYKNLCDGLYDSLQVIDRIWEILQVLEYKLFVDNFITILEDKKIRVFPRVIEYMMCNREFITTTAKQKAIIYEKLYTKKLDSTKLKSKIRERFNY